MRFVRDPGQQGFTLLELLISITLLGLIMVMLFGGLRLGTRVWESAEAGTEQFSRVEIVQGFVRRILQRAQPLMRRDGRSRQQVTFVGRRDSVEFVALMPPHMNLGGFHHVIISTADSGNLKKLVVKHGLLEFAQPDEVDMAGAAGGEETKLLDAVSNVEFGYYGARDTNEQPRWHREWIMGPALPELFRVRISFADEDKRTWPELIVSPRIRTSFLPRGRQPTRGGRQ